MTTRKLVDSRRRGKWQHVYDGRKLLALAVYDGTHCRGHILSRGKLGFGAFDQHDRPQGIFPSVKAAADALSEREGK